MPSVTDPAPERVAAGKKSYGHALKASALIGASTGIGLFFRIIRTKAIAVLVGPTGVGFLGLYSTISSLIGNLAGLGISTSGVRQISEAVGTGDAQRIARTIKTLRRVAFCSGTLGALLLLASSRMISEMTFGDGRHTAAVALLALVVFFSDISDAQAALVQGMRRVSDLARLNILGALFGTVFSVPIVYVWGLNGLAPSLVCVAFMSIVTSWWYARKIPVAPVQLSARETFAESSGLLRMGLAFMASGFLWMGSAYLVRLVILRQLGVDAAGFYQAAWALGGLYTGFVLRAMGADFYPRLTAVAGNNAECNRLANEQAEVVLLLACPGVLATLTFAPLVIAVFYSHNFGPAVGILRWICLGMLLQVTSWSVGFIVLAKGRSNIFFFAELFSNLCLVGLVWLGIRFFGLAGSGMGFFGMYFLNTLGICLVVRKLSGFRWSPANRHLLLFFSPLLAGVFLAGQYLPPLVSMVLGTIVTWFAGIYSLKTLCALVPVEKLPRLVHKLLKLLRLTPPLAAPGGSPP